MDNKDRYRKFCETTYVPIYSKPWWMDAICGPEHWDVWLYENQEEILAAMPYYMETRGSYRYITKAPLTQTNGIVFQQDNMRKPIAAAVLQGKIIAAACAFIKSLGLDVYEQQYHHSFQNWSPFFWNNYTCVLRYTYIIEDTSDLARVTDAISANYRKKIRKAQSITRVTTQITPEEFYDAHEKIFQKQGLPVPFSRELWHRLYHACRLHDAGQLLCAKDEAGNIHSLLFVTWDEKTMYSILGGYMPEFASSYSHSALTYHSIQMAHEKGLSYDFEGSMIQRIARSFREFGGTPTPYYRIRKVFNPEIVRREAEDYIRRVQSEENAL